MNPKNAFFMQNPYASLLSNIAIKVELEQKKRFKPTKSGDDLVELLNAAAATESSAVRKAHSKFIDELTVHQRICLHCLAVRDGFGLPAIVKKDSAHSSNGLGKTADGAKSAKPVRMYRGQPLAD